MTLNLSSTCAALLILLPAPAFADAGAAPATAIIASQEVAARIDSMMSPYFTASTPGATVIVVRDGRTVFRKAYGMANLARQQPMTPETSLRLGSLTKQFTATAILMLAEEGKLALTDEITRFLPDYPMHGQKITIEHLLTHTSGVKNYTDKPEFLAGMAADVTVPQMIDSFKNDPLDFVPGADAHYNNSGYFLLGAIIEKASGLPYAQFLEQRIFVPLGMTHTAYEGHERSPGPRAVGYSGTQAGFVPALPISMTQPYAAAAMVSTVDDLARWDAAVSSGKLLTAADWKRASTPYRLSTGKVTIYGYGWRIGQLQGTPMIWHPGAINGFHTFALRLPQQNVYVAVLSNAESGLVDPGMLAQKAAAIAIGQPLPEYKEIALDTATLDAYAGVYRIDQSGRRVFRRIKDQLVMQRSGRSPVPVRAFSQTAFFVPITLDRFEFTRNAKGGGHRCRRVSGR